MILQTFLLGFVIPCFTYRGNDNDMVEITAAGVARKRAGTHTKPGRTKNLAFEEASYEISQSLKVLQTFEIPLCARNDSFTETPVIPFADSQNSIAYCCFPAAPSFLHRHSEKCNDEESKLPVP